MFTNLSNTTEYPKTLIIRNHLGGMIWQVYHVETMREADILSSNATMNGFQAITLEDYQDDMEQTFPNWRNECTFVEK